MAATVAGLGVLALLAAVAGGMAAPRLVGLLLAPTGLLEIAHGFRRSSEEARRAAWSAGAITLLMSALLVNAATLVGAALVVGLAGWFAVDALRYLVRAARGAGRGHWGPEWALPALGNSAVAALLLLLRESAGELMVVMAGVLRIGGTAWNIASASTYSAGDSGRTVVRDQGLPDDPALRDLADRIAAEETTRTPVDRGWIGAFVVALLAIHLGRMGLDRSPLGVMSPAIAVIGDLCVALVIAYGIVIPSRLAWRRLTRGPERQAWQWCLDGRGRPWVRWIVRVGLEHRLRFAVRLRSARYSLGTALSRGLQIGLPGAAVIAATVPIFGMSWFFDTENWAAGAWNAWAEARADTWRQAMVRAVYDHERTAGRPHPFAVTPPGIGSGADFSFLVVGDPGEGDASQHALRDQILAAARRDDVRFLVVSSDVVYPTGAMRDYEAKFWLPFKGTGKPVYAIPGNHDWYDALEAFAATFMEPEASRIAMRARVEVDGRITSTTDGRIDTLIAEAARLRHEYRVPSGFQRAPFFQFQTERFALIAVDTGVGKRIDGGQRAWLEAALAAARGKLIMAILGHPLYAGGHYQASANEDFAALHGLLRDHGVAIVMAGDTHDLEYYAEPDASTAPSRIMHHFVNGGGGAYLSFGAALAWPARPATDAWAFYPPPDAVTAKIQANLPPWKRPLWWWTRRFAAWPFSVEWLSAAFDDNVAPFYQSFMEVRVEASSDRVRLWPIGVNGRLRWAELRTSAGLVPPGACAADLVEWVIPMPPASPAGG
jgi:3',5'-cyclic AMP phosphodiesterase CpdA/uncharacterized membrane protein HdeD (DUF308 family)